MWAQILPRSALRQPCNRYRASEKGTFVGRNNTGRRVCLMCTCGLSAVHTYVRIQWNLIITVTLGPNLAGCYIEVAFLLSGIQNHHN